MGYKIEGKANNHWPKAYRLQGFLGRVRELAGVRFALCLWSTRVAGDEYWKSLLYIDYLTRTSITDALLDQLVVKPLRPLRSVS
jgi:hypothetical protein